MGFSLINLPENPSIYRILFGIVLLVFAFLVALADEDLNFLMASLLVVGIFLIFWALKDLDKDQKAKRNYIEAKTQNLDTRTLFGKR